MPEGRGSPRAPSLPLSNAGPNRRSTPVWDSQTGTLGRADARLRQSNWRSSTVRGVVSRRPIQLHDVEILRRSLVAGGLPATEVTWMLEELQRLLIERNQIHEILSSLGAPWAEVRRELNELHRLSRSD